MKQDKITIAVRRELKKYIDIAYRDGERKFFKEPIKNIGVRLPNRRLVAQKLWPRVNSLTKPQLFKICEKLFSGFSEEMTVASAWLWRSRQKFTAEDFKQFEIWVDKYFDNWAKVDDFCTHVLGYLINHFPRLTPKVFSWTKSKNRWMRRAAAVSLIYPWGKPKQFLPQILKTAMALLEDRDDLVQKGYGWMLKEAGNHNQAAVFDFVMKHKSKMPRTALRYAIEKFPLKLKQQAMKK